MGIVYKNNAKTTLSSSINTTDTSISVTDGSVFPSLSSGEFFLVTFDSGTNNEIAKCTARSGNTLTVVRAQEGTTARSFSSGDAAEGRVTAGFVTAIQENIAAKSANQTVFNATTASSATTYNIGVNPGVEANAMVFLNGVLQHHDTISFSGTNLTFDAAPPNGMALEVIVDNLINLQSSNLTVDSFTAADVGGSPQTDFTLSDAPAAETNLIVFIDGVFQDQDAYTISSNTLTITTGVIAGRGVTVYVINPVNIGTPSDSTVTSAKLSGNITMPGNLIVGSNDVAFDSPTFVVDHTNSRVGLGTASPSVPVDIVGDVKMSANLTVDTNTLVVDSSNNRVGIGLSPTEKLEVAGNVFINTSGNPNLTVKTSGAGNNPTLKLQADSNHWQIQSTFSNTNDELFFMYNSSTKLALDKNGNLGLGTESPAFENGNGLEIRNSSGNGSHLKLTDNASGTGATEGFDLYMFNSQAYIENYENAPIIFRQNGGETARFESGHFGMGISSPVSKVHIQGPSASTYTGNGPSDVLRVSSSSAGAWIASDFDGMFGYMGLDSSTTAKFAAYNYATGTEGNMILGQNRVYIKNNGYVGINYTSPSSLLHLLGQDGSTSTKITVQTDDTADAKASLLLMSRNSSNTNKNWELINDEGYGVGISRTTTGPYGIRKMASNTQISAGSGWVVLTGFTTNASDLGGHFSNGAFVAPVTGIYSIGSHFMIYSVSATNYFLVKGNHLNSSGSGLQEYYVKHTEYTEGSSNSHNYYGYDSNQSLNLYMSKGDIYRYEAFSGSGNGHVGTASYFSVCLIG